MTLRMEVGLGSGHVVLNGDPAPVLLKEADNADNADEGN